MADKAHGKGSERPPVLQDHVRLYATRFCPFAERTKLTLFHKEIKHDVVFINLSDKPEWYLDLNPFGLVPTIEVQGKIVYESTVCNEYLDEVYPEKKLVPRDSYQKAKEGMVMARFNKLMSVMFKLMAGRDSSPNNEVYEELYTHMDVCENILQQPYFGGSEPTLLDFSIWPWIGRMPAFAKLLSVDILDTNRFPKLVAYIKTMRQLPAVRKTMYDDDTYIKYWKRLI